MKLSALLFFFSLFTISCFGQVLLQKDTKWSFGPQLGIRGEALYVNHVVDSVAIVSQGNGLKKVPILSLFLERKISNALSARAEITYLRSASSFTVYHLRPPDPGWGVVVKGLTIPNNFIQVPIIVSLQLPLVRNRLSLGVVGGINSHFQFGGDSPYMKVDNRSVYYQQEADVMNNMDKTRRSYVPYSIIGFRATLGRFSLIGRYEENINHSFLKNLQVGEKSYYLPSRKAYSYLTLGYHFYSLKRKNKRD